MKLTQYLIVCSIEAEGPQGAAPDRRVCERARRTLRARHLQRQVDPGQSGLVSEPLLAASLHYA
jgi:hypothetical protein